MVVSMLRPHPMISLFEVVGNVYSKLNLGGVGCGAFIDTDPFDTCDLVLLDHILLEYEGELCSSGTTYSYKTL